MQFGTDGTRPPPPAVPLAGGLRLHDALLWVLLACIGVGWLGQLHLVLRDTPVHSVDLLFDDAYYYLGVAWNLAHGHGSKFAEPLATNGYHPLWLLLLSGAAALFDLSKQGLVCAALTLTALAKCLGLWLFGRGQADAGWRSVGRIALFLAIAKFPFVFSQGLETTLFVVFIPWLLQQAKVYDWSNRQALLTGGAMSLVFLTRIDALALDMAVLALAVATRRASWRAASLAALPLAGTVVVYAAVNLHFFGTPVPVSGQAKAIGLQPGGNIGTTLDYFGSLRWTVLMLAVWAAARFSVAPRLAIGRFELASLAAALLVCALYYGALSGWPIWPWYLYPNAFLAVYASVAGAAGAAAFWRWARRTWLPQVDRSRLASAGWVLGGCLAANHLVQLVRNDDMVRPHLLAWWLHRDPRDPAHSSFNQQNVALIPWLVERYPAGAAIAMGDRAGGLGYYLPRQFSLYQTEGLVADRAFLQTLRDGALETYLAQRGVDLFIADRPRGFVVDGVMGFVEPVQPRATSGPVNLLCFPATAQLLAQDYRWGHEPQLRRVFDFSQRSVCSPRMRAEVQALRSRYDGVRAQAGF